MVLETEYGVDDTEVRGIKGVYRVVAVVEGELYEVWLKGNRKSDKVVGYAYSDREAMRLLRDYDLG